MAKRRKIKWTPEVISAAKTAAVALAEFWDALFIFEQANGISFDGTADMLGSYLAPECGHPPAFADLPNDVVVNALNTLGVE